MKPGSNSKRSRGRGNNPRRPNNAPRTQVFESNGPEVRVRGTVNQVLEKYLALARDASSSGDYVSAENFFQHAEHYYRILSANGANHGHVGIQQRLQGPGQGPAPQRGPEGPRPQAPADAGPQAPAEAGSHGAQPAGGNGSGTPNAAPDVEQSDLGPPDTTPSSR